MTKIQLDSLIKENQFLFVIFGIFLALSVYLNQFLANSANTDLLKIGITSSLIIAELLAFLILKKILCPETETMLLDSDQPITIIHTWKIVFLQLIRSIYSIEIIIFTSAFIALNLVILFLIFSSNVIMGILVPIFYLAGIAVLFKYLVFVTEVKISELFRALIIFGLLGCILYYCNYFVSIAFDPFDKLGNLVGFFFLGFASSYFLIFFIAILIGIAYFFKESILKLKELIKNNLDK
jgi:hypothetical protein